MRREYEAAAGRIPTTGDRDTRMQTVVDALWEEFARFGVSWVGFYLDQPGKTDDERLLLGPHRDTPACSPIGLHGVCGLALTSRGPRIVDDVRSLGGAYVACDPRDRSEIVIALIDSDNACWGVLDLDSREVASFDESDAAGLITVLAAAGLHEAT